MSCSGTLPRLVDFDSVNWIDLNVLPEDFRPSTCLTSGQTFIWQEFEVLDDSESSRAFLGELEGHVFAILETASTTKFKCLSHFQDSYTIPGPATAPQSHAGQLEQSLDPSSQANNGFPLREKTGTLPFAGCRLYLEKVLRLDTYPSLSPLHRLWMEGDSRFIQEAIDERPGHRALKLPALATIFSFILSSNNNITRISALARRLNLIGAETPLLFLKGITLKLDKLGLVELEAAREKFKGCLPNSSEVDIQGWVPVLAFPKLQNLAEADSQQLQFWGFGYRASYVLKTAQTLLQHANELDETSVESGLARYVAHLETLPFIELRDRLCTFPGIGRKVATCIALFGFSHLHAIPVDTHVWQLACQKFDFDFLRGRKTPSNRDCTEIENAFFKLYGTTCGWACAILFASRVLARKNAQPNTRKIKRTRVT